MGVAQSQLKESLWSQRTKDRCLPLRPYLPFPAHLHPAEPDGLVLKIRALPSSEVRLELPGEAFWWNDVQFLPYSDAQLITMTSAFTLHSVGVGMWLPVPGVSHGRILMYDTGFQPIKGHVFKGSRSSAYPKVQMHPLGEAFAYAGNAELRLDSLWTNETLFSRPRDIHNRAQRFCAVSGNGVYIALLTRGGRSFSLEILQLSNSLQFALVQPPQPLADLSPAFASVPLPFRPTMCEHVECRWSPDSSHLAISSSNGCLFLYNRRTAANVCEVCPLYTHQELSSAAAYDFDPRVRYSQLAVGTREGVLMTVEVIFPGPDSDEDSEEGEVSKGNGCRGILGQVDTGGEIDCVHFSQDGAYIAVSLRSFIIGVYDSEDLTSLHTFDMAALCPEISPFQGCSFPAINRLSFSYDGRYLASSSCDGFLRVWAVPRMLSLREWCRVAVLKATPIASVRDRLQCPEQIRKYLLAPSSCW